MSVFDTLADKARDQVAFLFEDAGDSIFYIKGAGLAALAVDTIDDETHTWDNDVSQYPVEGAADISDNIKPKPDEVKVRCFVSNTPIHGLIDEVLNFADRFLNGRKRTQEAFNQLLALRALRIPVTVATRYRVYENVGITNVQIIREPSAGESIVFDVTFREINIVKAQTGNVPPGLGAAGKQSDNSTKKRGAAKVEAGKSTGTAGNTSTANGKNGSVLKSLPEIFKR